MTLDGILTFIGIGAAILAIAEPIQRRALVLLLPPYLSLLLLSAILLTLSAKWVAASCPGLSILYQGLGFALLIALLILAWIHYRKARLTGRKSGAFSRLLGAALLENRFSEVERILQSNRSQLPSILDREALRLLFERKLVQAMQQARSLLHLELLADDSLLESLPERFAAVDAVVRGFLSVRISPIHSAVVREYGGDESLVPHPEHFDLFETTFGNPHWYLATRADYPLLLTALEALRSGKLDVAYNGIDERYDARQGISSRVCCPVYLAAKTHVIALDRAVSKQVEGDFYVSDLWDLFREILPRSSFREDVWNGTLEPPTPYAYLLAGILDDLRDLSRRTLKRCCHEEHPEPDRARPLPPLDTPRHYVMDEPPKIARDLASVWSYCTSDLAGSTRNTSPHFRTSNIREHLDFILQLRYAPHEAFGGGVAARPDGIERWHELFLGELAQTLANSDDTTKQHLRETIGRLDSRPPDLPVVRNVRLSAG